MAEPIANAPMNRASAAHPVVHEPPAHGGSFRNALAAVRLSLPYPDELGERVSPESLQRLAESVLQPVGDAQMLSYAKTMPSRQLMRVFPLLAMQRNRSNLADRLMLIIRERACASLLQVGYVEFQRHYPHPLITPAVAVLCGILKIRKIAYPPILHDFIHVNSHSLIARCVRKAIDKRFSLHRFLTTYRIDPTLPLGTLLCAQFLRTGDEAVYLDSALLFEQVLLKAGPELQADLLTRFFKLERITPVMFDQYCQIIYEHLGEPVDNLPAWDHVRPKDMVRYVNWIKEATIGSHFAPDLDKARFFLRYRHSLISVSEVGKDTIVMHFPGFSITHSRRWPDSAMYRDMSRNPENPQVHRDPSDDHTDINAADPRRPHRLPMEALKKSSTAGRVLLLLDPEGMRQSGVFLDYCLSRLRSLTQLPKWLPKLQR